MDHGTDRDVALSMVTALNSCAELIASINDNLYVPHITTQPTDMEVAAGETATITVVANNVSTYEWQYRTANNPTWREMFSGATGANTASVSFEVTATRQTYLYRCLITGKDGSEITTNNVHITEPEAEG